MRWYIFSARALNIDQITLKETYNIGLITSNHARVSQTENTSSVSKIMEAHLL